jgi:L-alanine-DL-glutamate epimerase-like enolase superfamily enzyme
MDTRVKPAYDEHSPKTVTPMHITTIRTHILEAALSQPFAYSRAWYDTRTAMLVEIETDSGLVGWGECYGPARITASVVNSVAAWLIGDNVPLTINQWQTVFPLWAGIRGSTVHFDSPVSLSAVVA